MIDWRTRLLAISSRRPVAPATPPPKTIFAFDQSTPPVPRQYLPLYIYLEHRYAAIVVLTFAQIETLLGFALPAPAYTESEWWTGEETPAHGLPAAWAEAGRVATPNLPAKAVTFARP